MGVTIECQAGRQGVALKLTFGGRFQMSDSFGGGKRKERDTRERDGRENVQTVLDL